MKLFIIAALIAAVSAARLEHLERGYLPPSSNNYGANSGGSSFPSAGAHGNFGFNQGSQYNTPGRGSNGLEVFGRGNDFVGNNAGSNGFGANGHGSNGFGANGHGSNGFGSNGRQSNGFGGNHGNGVSGRNGASSAATSNQYLPPNYGSSGSNSGSNFGSSIRPSCSTCGSSTFGSSQPQRYQQGSFGSQGLSIPSTQYGSPQSFGPSSFGSQQSPSSSFGSQQSPSSSFGSQQRYTAQDEPSGASRQYLAPKTSSQNTPQQPFDENTGYIY